MMTVYPDENSTTLARARGCLLGQLAGDALGSLVEFQSPEEIHRSYPEGVRELADGGTWNTIAGQPTDDSEMALLLARMLTERGPTIQTPLFRPINSGSTLILLTAA